MAGEAKVFSDSVCFEVEVWVDVETSGLLACWVAEDDVDGCASSCDSFFR